MSNLMSERMALVAALDPVAIPTGIVTTGWIDMAKTPNLLAVIMAGALGAGGTIDAKLQQASSAAGAGAKDIAGKAITQLTQAGTNKSNKQVQINLRGEELDRNGGFSFVRLSMTVAVATSVAGAVVLGAGARFGPSANAASVIETVK